jgi:hypothetical protein
MLLICSVVSLTALTDFTGRQSKAQDAATAPPVPVATPSELVDQIMGLIGQGKIDDSIALMEGLKNQPDLREAARNRLVRLREDEGNYHGYDIAAVQRFTSQFQTLDVLAYYDDQPVLMRLHFYRPQKDDSVKWMVLEFQVHTGLAEITDELKDTPIDYVGRK